MRVDPTTAYVVAAFSILGRIGGDATGQKVRRSGNPVLPFSILGRIGGDATECAGHGHQHPRFPFSILGRIGGDATLASWLWML